jgi:hypothetical protein
MRFFFSIIIRTQRKTNYNKNGMTIYLFVHIVCSHRGSRYVVRKLQQKLHNENASIVYNPEQAEGFVLFLKFKFQKSH